MTRAELREKIENAFSDLSIFSVEDLRFNQPTLVSNLVSITERYSGDIIRNSGRDIDREREERAVWVQIYCAGVSGDEQYCREVGAADIANEGLEAFRERFFKE